MNRNYKVGDKVNVRAHNSKPGAGLSYPEFSGVLLDDAGCSEGWDVVDCRDIVTGEERSIYCYSIQRD